MLSSALGSIWRKVAAYVYGHYYCVISLLEHTWLLYYLLSFRRVLGTMVPYSSRGRKYYGHVKLTEDLAE